MAAKSRTASASLMCSGSILAIMAWLAAPLPQRVDGRGVGGFIGAGLGSLLQDVAEFVDALHQAVLGEGVHREFDRAAAGRGQRLVGQIDLHDGAGAGGEEFRVHVRRHHDWQQRILQRVLLENIGEAGRDHRAEAPLGKRPGSVLARTAAAEVVAGQQHLDALRRGPVEHEIGVRIARRVVAPIVEELLVETLLGGGLQEARRNNLVGIHVVQGQRDHTALEIGEWDHSSVLTSVTTPMMALAAAVSGLARKVRPPLPCRPSKLRLLVETLYWPGASWSPFMAMHMEQPGSRHSQPAARKISGSPSAMAWRLTSCDPGTTITRTLPLTLRPFSRPAAVRRSLIRELVQLPMKTTSMGCPTSGLPPSRPM